MNAEIMAVGTEIILGDIVNTNAQYLSVELSKLGINVYYHSAVGDNPDRLKAALNTAFSRSDLVITTGGLGPTGDDLTKETACEFLEARLVLHQESLNRIKAYFERIGKPMVHSNEKQAYLPENAAIFANESGTAPGFGLKKNGKVLIMLPGPPREMTIMYERYAKPFLQEMSDAVIATKEIRVFGIGEAAAEEKLKDLMGSANPTLAPYAKTGEVLLRVTAKADTEEKAKELTEPMVSEICKRLEGFVYGIDVKSLQEAAVNLLIEKNKKVAVAESCTGGLLAGRITEISGSSQIFVCGVVAYANNIKISVLKVKSETLAQYGAVSEQTAIEMAEGVRLLAGADIGIGITGIAGPTGGTPEKPCGLVYVALSDGKNAPAVKKLMIGRGGNDEREYIRYVAASNAIDMIIKYLK